MRGNHSVVYIYHLLTYRKAYPRAFILALAMQPLEQGEYLFQVYLFKAYTIIPHRYPAEFLIVPKAGIIQYRRPMPGNFTILQWQFPTIYYFRMDTYIR